MKTYAHLLTNRRQLLSYVGLGVIVAAFPNRSFAEKGVPMSVSPTPINDTVVTLENLKRYGLLGLQHTDPDAGWQRIQIGDWQVRAFSAAHPQGTELSYEQVLAAAKSGLSNENPNYAGCKLEGVFGGHGLIGACLT